MKQTCPQCGEPVSKRWLLFGSPFEAYFCPRCRSRLEWTPVRYLVSFFAGILAVIPVFFLAKFTLFSVGMIAVYFVALLISVALMILFTPGQFRLARSGHFKPKEDQ
ncbi:MAG: hypothetical protein GXO77_01885 [Calditrichaeota bacterium]|nr:hypothetical protein [Calditrichota bacterium]